ncbi:MAG: N-acetylmuramoyl-L-alanine amidase [Actinoplanes sp.]
MTGMTGMTGVPAAEAAGRTAAELTTVAAGGRQSTGPFSLVGVTWADPRAALTATVRVRTRDAATHRWGAWQTLEADGGIRGVRGATDPLWTGPSDGVESRITGPRPAGLRLDLINPDAPVPAMRRPPATGGWGVPTRPARARASMPTRPVPRMVTRSGWGANESIVKGPPEYTGSVEVFFVHHTASGNGYSCRQSAGIVRGIQAYQVRSRGWDDIGYNFLVDKCGTIFEGRAGGVGRSVLGAHTLGFNENASAVAVIGSYDRVGVSARVRTAVATLAAYKLGAWGNYPNSAVSLTSAGGDRYARGARATFRRIAGHRDAGRTACPGTSLYGQLGSIRALAGGGPVGLRMLRMTGAVKSGPYLYTRGVIRPLWTLATPSALINRFEVWVDGKLTVATPGSHRLAALRLNPGGHTVIVRALHLSGRSTTVTSKVIADPNAPIFSQAPDVVLRPGSLAGTVPIRLDWQATDPNLASVALIRPSLVDLGATTRSRNGTIRPAVPTTFVLRAADRAGNSVNASVTRTPMVVSEGLASRTGTWRALRNPDHLGGVALSATTRGASATWTFTGRSAAIATGRSASAGQVRIFMDGVDQGVVDLRAPGTLFRQATWTRWWAESEQHTVRVEVEEPGVVLDGLVYLK